MKNNRSFSFFSPPSLPPSLSSGNWVRLSLLVKEGGNYTLSLFGTSNSGGTLTLTLDDYLQRGKAVVRTEGGREGRREGHFIIYRRELFSNFVLSPPSLPPSPDHHGRHSRNRRVPSMGPVSRHCPPSLPPSRPGPPNCECDGH
jgi:hypothetical protein